ncbi:MAG: HlyD family efflux transporter periplasmic adaptor subunit [Rhodobacterales bacterium]|nr:MAG: HlyD family efflux transporter periplasmic adaptor subunit [Rhodobacterales bacterium]
MIRTVVPLAVAVLFAAPQAQAQSTTPGLTPALGNVPVNCAIRPLQVVELAAPFAGVVRKVFVRPGQQVAAGDPIAEFDDDLTRASYEAALARTTLSAALEATRRQKEALARKVERLRSGVERRIVSQADLEAAELELAQAEGAVGRELDLLQMARIEAEQAKIALDKAVVVSPVAGQIGEDLIDQGEAPTQKPIAVIYVNDPLRVEAFVPTAGLAAFLARDNFEIVINGNFAQPVPVTLDYVSQVADLSSNSQSVYFILDAPGMIPGYQCVIPPLGG